MRCRRAVKRAAATASFRPRAEPAGRGQCRRSRAAQSGRGLGLQRSSSPAFTWAYGRDLHNGSTLTTLVRRLAEWDADVVFRISSLEPMDCTNEIVELVATSPRLAPHFHLPLQHGADDVLRRMRRPCTTALPPARRADSPQRAARIDRLMYGSRRLSWRNAG